MKPKLSYCSWLGWWFCASRETGFTTAVVGNSPLEAYRKWAATRE